MTRFNFSTKNRITDKKEFDILYKTGEKIFGKYLVINYSLLSENEPSRLGLTVSKKVDKNAANRNYIKRVLREIFRIKKENFTNNFAIVITAKKSVKEKKYQEITDDLNRIFIKSGLIAKNENPGGNETVSSKNN